VGPRVGLDRCGKSRPHRDSIPGPSSPWPVAIPTTLPGAPHNLNYQSGNLLTCIQEVSGSNTSQNIGYLAFGSSLFSLVYLPKTGHDHFSPQQFPIHYSVSPYREPRQISRYSNYRLDDSIFESRQKQGICLFSKTSRLVLRPKYPPTTWAPRSLRGDIAAVA